MATTWRSSSPSRFWSRSSRKQRDDAVGRRRAEDDLARLLEDGVEVEDRAERLRHLVEQREYVRLAAQLFEFGVLRGGGGGALDRGGRRPARTERGADDIVGRDQKLRVAERLVLEARLGLRRAALVGEVEAESARADLDDVAVAQRMFEPLLAVDEDMVGRELAVHAAVYENVGAVAVPDVRVVARGARVVKDDAVVRRAPDGADALRREWQLPGTPAGVRDV